MRSVTSTVLTLVLFATYLGVGALAHDTHFSLGWALGCTVLVWAGPAQIRRTGDACWQMVARLIVCCDL
jgi:predicted branched-subunit amino acid permease